MTEKPLEDLLREAAKSGRLNHLSIAWLHTGLWGAAYRGQAHTDHRMVDHPDVVCALRAALTGKPGSAPVIEKPKRTRAKAAAPVVDDILGDLM